MEVTKRFIPVSFELQKLALRVGNLFGLDIYGLDVVETAHGPVVVDINDFPSFGQIPQAVPLVAAYILQLANHNEFQRVAPVPATQLFNKTMIKKWHSNNIAHHRSYNCSRGTFSQLPKISTREKHIPREKAKEGEQ